MATHESDIYPDRQTGCFVRFRETGDPEAFDNFYVQTVKPLFASAKREARSHADALELIQATYLTALLRRERFDPERPVGAWLRGILKNVARDARRSRRSRQTSSAVFGSEPPGLSPSSSVSPGAHAEAAETRAQIDRSIRRLPGAWQEPVFLQVIRGLSIDEIAARLDRPTGTIRSQVSRGKAELRRLLPRGLTGLLAGLGLVGRASANPNRVAAGWVGRRSASGTVAPSLGGVVVKKALAVIALVAFVTLVWLRVDWGGPERVTSDIQSTTAPTVASDVQARAEQEPIRQSSPSRPDVTAEQADREILIANPGDRLGHVLVRVVDEISRQPVGGCAVIVAIGGTSSWNEQAYFTGESGLVEVRDLPEGDVLVRILRGSRRVFEVVPGETVEVVLDRFPGVTAELLVVDDLGPVGNASIWLSDRWSRTRGKIVGVSDGVGRFVLSGVGPEHLFGALRETHVRSALHSVEGSAGSRVAVTIHIARGGGRVVGRVIDGAGSAIPGAVVTCGGADPNAKVVLNDGTSMPAGFPAFGRTDAEGRFELTGLPCGSSRMKVRATDFAPGDLRVEVQLSTDLEVRLQPESRIEGRVVDRGGRAVVGAIVRASRRSSVDPDDEENVSESEARSDDLGMFHLAGVGSGEYIVSARRDDVGFAELPVTCVPGAAVSQDLILTGVPTIHGQVTDARGFPVSDWLVTAQRSEDREDRHHTTTDADGRFLITMLDEASYRLYVNEPRGHRLFPAAIEDGVRPGPMPVEFRVGVTQGGVLVGRVVDSNRHPVPGVKVGFWHDDQRIWRSYSNEAGTGSFRVEGIPPGRIHVGLYPKTHGQRSLGEVVVTEGGTQDLGVIELDDPGFIRVRLTRCLTSGEDAPTDLLMRVVDESGEEFGALARVEDGYRSVPLSAGPYQVRVSGSGIADRALTFQVEMGLETHRSLELDRVPSRLIELVPPDGSALPRATWVSLKNPAGDIVWRRGGLPVNEAGRIVVSASAEAGTYRLIAGTNTGLEAFEGAVVIQKHEPRLRVLLH